MVRFINSPKQVNKQWAIKLIDEIPPQKTNKRVVWCDGGSGAEGHPRVFINLVRIFRFPMCLYLKFHFCIHKFVMYAG